MAGPGSRRTGWRRMSTTEQTAVICSATRGRNWPLVATTVRANSTGSQTRPVVSREAFGGSPLRKSKDDRGRSSGTTAKVAFRAR